MKITESCTIQDKKFSDWTGKDTDGLQISGDIDVIVENCVFDRQGEDPTNADELCSVINGARVIFRNCFFGNSGKGVLVGTGSSNDEDVKLGQSAKFEYCLFENLSRRCPYVNAGKAILKNCTIKNWGKDEFFYEKSAGVRGGSHANITLIDCKFEQETFFKCITRKNAWKDLFNQYLFPFLGFGFMRGAYAERGGKIKCVNCTKNRWWIVTRSTG